MQLEAEKYMCHVGLVFFSKQKTCLVLFIPYFHTLTERFRLAAVESGQAPFDLE